MKTITNGVALDSFVLAYVECALWSSTGDNGEPLDADYSIDDIASEGLASMVKDCDSFRELAAESLADANQTDEQNGHDFWLTRNGHGAGFWDRGLGDVGQKLTDDAHSFGSSDLYVGDDGKIYTT